MAATVGVEIAGKRAEQRKSGVGEAHYIMQTGRAEAERSVSWARRRASLIANKFALGAGRRAG